MENELKQALIQKIYTFERYSIHNICLSSNFDCDIACVSIPVDFLLSVIDFKLNREHGYK